MARSFGLGAFGALLLTSCSAPSPSSTAAGVASVNGVTLTQEDLALAMKPRMHGGTEPLSKQEALDALVREELMRQRAVELGLFPEPPAAAELAKLEASLQAAKRRGFAEALLKHQGAAQKATVTDTEARAYYEQNARQFQTDVRVLQLFLRDEAQIQAAVKELDAGAAFDEVARKDGRVPDMGFLDWRQVPPAWRSAVYALKPGERTGIIKGPNNRFWVLQLLETRPNASLTFEQVKTQLIAELQTQRSAPLAAQLSEQLRAKATVVFSPGNADSAR